MVELTLETFLNGISYFLKEPFLFEKFLEKMVHF